jgi:phosphatidylinositol-4,5-bisphosphate 3-kinase
MMMMIMRARGVQVVLNCSTSADIQLESGGIKAAFSDKPLARWLRRQSASNELFARAVENLVRSCAASCVATYVLGVCDRHNDNIMITKDGRLFHIDFGRFLGNYQMFGAFRRDRAPFVLTPEFVFAMGGKESSNFERFCDMACKAFNVVRSNARVFIALFSMMVSTGIPELQVRVCVHCARSHLDCARSRSRIWTIYVRRWRSIWCVEVACAGA